MGLLFRLALIVVTVIAIALPLYKLLMKLAKWFFTEFSDEEDLDSQFESITDQKEKLREQCKQQERDAVESIQAARRVNNKLKRR